MSTIYINLIELGLAFLKQFLSSLLANKAPQNVLDAVSAAIVAVESHKNDAMTKAQWEAQRG